MTSWKRVVTMATMFVTMVAVGFAAEAEKKREGPPGPEERAKLSRTAATMVARYVAKEVGLAADKTDKFVAGMAAEREASDKKRAEAEKSGEKLDFRALSEERTKSVEAVLNANMTPEQAKKAREIYGSLGFMTLDRSVADLLTRKVEQAKVEKALPVLVKYNKAVSDLMAKVRAQEISREDMGPKMQELRAATAKELAPIIGEAAATQWQSQPARGMGFGGRGGAPPREGDKPAGETREKGERKERKKEGAPGPVAP